MAEIMAEAEGRGDRKNESIYVYILFNSKKRINILQLRLWPRPKAEVIERMRAYMYIFYY